MPVHKEQIPVWRDRNVLRLLAITFTTFISFGLTLSALPMWAAKTGSPIGRVGTVTTAMLLCTIAVQMAVPRIVESMGQARATGLGIVLLGAPGPFYLVSPAFRWLVVVSIVRGVGFAILTVFVSTMAVTLTNPQRRGRAVGLYGLAVAIPTLIAVPTGVMLTTSGHFAWVASSSALPIASLGIARSLTASSSSVGALPPRQPARGDVLGALRPSLVLFAITFAGGAFLTFLPIDPVNTSEAGLAVWLFSLSAAISRWQVGVLADRLGASGPLACSVVTAVAGLACIVAALADSLPAVFVPLGSAVFGLGYGATQNLTLLKAVANATRQYAATAIWNMSFDAGTALGALVGGIIASTSLGVPGALAVAAAAIAGGGLLLIPSRRSQQVWRGG